jgi:hypothetical protein
MTTPVSFETVISMPKVSGHSARASRKTASLEDEPVGVVPVPPLVGVAAGVAVAGVAPVAGVGDAASSVAQPARRRVAKRRMR